MRKEVPVLQRCCFCLPLRGGLLAWGYLKLTIASLMLFYLLCILLQITEGKLVYNFTQFAIALLIVTADVILHSVFIVGCHKKNVKLLKVYYFYSLSLLVLTALFGVFCTGIIIGSNLNHYGRLFTTSMCRGLSTLFINLLIQVYVILLVKSKITKLDNMDSFKFQNNAAEALKYNMMIGSLCKEKEATIC
ncbi:unnamed protein product [Arctia plantaginis]|uniref:Uncharacterized protein n=1 Tax=Arctia plantaginis TaxID=874455 RepID=A0A8S0Z4Q0_ARCPL|nr:unnamed protein product [Arctia plantaginis]CAB3228292.1 unnamed protein product [Arctia plantaginis]